MTENSTDRNDSQWRDTMQMLRGAVAASVFDTHFLGAKGVTDGDTIKITLPRSANLEQVENRLSGIVKRQIIAVYGGDPKMQFVKVAAPRTVEQSMSATDDSEGFDIPLENWSKLPHGLIAQLPKFSSLAELKVVLYILRHTWGFQDEWKKITMDEFVNGRRTNNVKFACDCSECQGQGKMRIDHGLGMAPKNIRAGISKAIEHKFVTIEIDETDKARTKKYYSLNYKK